MTGVDIPGAGVDKSPGRGLGCHDGILVMDNRGLDSDEVNNGPEPASVLVTSSGCEAEYKEDY